MDKIVIVECSAPEIPGQRESEEKVEKHHLFDSYLLSLSSGFERVIELAKKIWMAS